MQISTLIFKDCELNYNVSKVDLLKSVKNALIENRVNFLCVRESGKTQQSYHVFGMGSKNIIDMDMDDYLHCDINSTYVVIRWMAIEIIAFEPIQHHLIQKLTYFRHYPAITYGQVSYKSHQIEGPIRYLIKQSESKIPDVIKLTKIPVTVMNIMSKDLVKNFKSNDEGHLNYNYISPLISNKYQTLSISLIDSWGQELYMISNSHLDLNQ